MIDSLLNFKEKAEASTILSSGGLAAKQGKNGAPTLSPICAPDATSDPSNVDNQDIFSEHHCRVEELATDCPGGLLCILEPGGESGEFEFGPGGALGNTTGLHRVPETGATAYPDRPARLFGRSYV